MVVRCSIGEGEAGLYRLHGVLRSVTADDGEHGDKGHRGHGRGHGCDQEGAESVMSVLEQGTVVKHSCLVTLPSSATAAIGELHGGDRSSAREWACPSSSWR